MRMVTRQDIEPWDRSQSLALKRLFPQRKCQSLQVPTDVGTLPAAGFYPHPHGGGSFLSPLIPNETEVHQQPLQSRRLPRFPPVKPPGRSHAAKTPPPF